MMTMRFFKEGDLVWSAKQVEIAAAELVLFFYVPSKCQPGREQSWSENLIRKTKYIFSVAFFKEQQRQLNFGACLKTLAARVARC